MGVFDNELILPGTITEIISDYSYGYDTSLFGTTDSVAIVGTAFNGPVGQVVQVYSPEHAAYVFGESYDYSTRREATLVAEIKDAWDRGCRTIYAIRVSGKSIHKDFELVPETKMKLRVAGLFPSNANKDIYMTYDSTEGAEAITIYKPAKRATIQEKLEGLVEREDSVLVSRIDIGGSYGLTKDSRLVELIKIVNEHYYNNVLKLSIVDDEGNDITISSQDAQALSVGALFPGAYFMGRDVNTGEAVTDVQYRFASENEKPYEGFTDAIFKRLSLNTDVNTPYPIFAEKVSDINEKLVVKMSSMFDFLSIPGKVDEVFKKNKEDYEEVSLTDFELYSKLGSGFAISARAEVNDQGEVKKVKETPVSDPNRIIGIADGIYSMLENLKSNYRVLACGSADSAITGKIPRKEEYRIARGKGVELQGKNSEDMIRIESIVDKKDFNAPKSYKFSLESIDDIEDNEDVKEHLYTKKTVKAASLADAIGDTVSYPEGEFVLVKEVDSGDTVTKLCRVTNGKVTQLLADKNTSLVGGMFFNGKDVLVTEAVGNDLIVKQMEVINLQRDGSEVYKYVLVEEAGSVYIYKLADSVSVLDGLTPIGSVSEVLNESDDKTLVTVQTSHGKQNLISIRSSEFDYTTLEEFVAALNEDPDLGKLFKFSLTAAGVAEKDSVVLDVFGKTSEVVFPIDKEIGADTNLYIPYKTTDNFARHLAQHCTYTSLKTAPTHGVIGCTKLIDVNLNSVAAKVSKVADINFNLYAKKPNGRDILDRNNMPYPIGKNVSVVVGQYIVNTLDGYSYISNCASGYAGMVSILPLDQSSTNQPINSPAPMYELTNYQLGRLTQKGFVTIKQSYTQGYVITDGITMAPVASPFRRLSTTRITNSVEEVIRAAVEPFIGKQNHLANRNSMQTALKSGLDKLTGRLIKDYTFKLQYDTAAARLGIVNIDYRIIPVYEIREVRNNISVGETL